jgi:hypothetical protein
MADLGCDDIESVGCQGVQLLGSAIPHVSGVGNDGVRPQRSTQLHRVLECRQRLLALVRVLNRQHREVRRVDRQCDAACGGHLPELRTPPLLPGEPVDERQLERFVPPCDERIEELLVAGIVWRHSGDTKTNHAHTLRVPPLHPRLS